MIVGRELRLAVVMMVACVSVSAQAPQPFPKPSPPAPPAPTAPAPSSPARVAPSIRPQSETAIPNETTLGAPIHPGAQFISSYDAGRGQRFHLFGVDVPFVEMVSYYRTALKQKGEVLFESPPTHQFDTSRFREETMAFPPSVTIKDYTWGGSAGYPNPKREGRPQHFATVIQIVSAPAGIQP